MGCTFSSDTIDVEQIKKSLNEKDDILNKVLASKYKLSLDDETYLAEKVQFHAYLLSLIYSKPHVKKEYFNGEDYIINKEFINLSSPELSYNIKNAKIAHLTKENAELKYKLENFEPIRSKSEMNTPVHEPFFSPSFNIIETPKGILFLFEIPYLNISTANISITPTASKTYNLNIDAERIFGILEGHHHFLARGGLATKVKVDYNFEASKDIDVRHIEPTYEDGILKFLILFKIL